MKMNVSIKSTTMALFLAAAPAHSATYKWPYTASIEIDITSATTATYKHRMSSATINDPTILISDTVETVLAKKGIPDANHMVWGLYHRHNNPGGEPTASATNKLDVPLNSNFVNAADNLERRFGTGYIGVTSHSNTPNGNECVGSTLYNGGYYQAPMSSFLAHSWNGGATSAQDSCIGTPPVNQWCALLTPELTLSYPDMKVENAAGATVSGDVQVHCTTGMKYTLRLRTPMGIALSNGMTAQLTANGLPLNSALNGETGDNTVKITSTLEGSPEKSGEFKGENILYVSYP